MKFCVIRDSTAPNGSKDASSNNEDRLKAMEEDLSYLRRELNEESRMRYELISDLGNLKRRNQVENHFEKGEYHSRIFFLFIFLKILF